MFKKSLSDSRSRYSHRRRILLFGLLILSIVAASYPISPTVAQERIQSYQHLVEPGDTWAALARRYNLDEQMLRTANPHINQQRQPVIGKNIYIPGDGIIETTGTLVTVNDGGMLQLAVQYDRSPWSLALSNDAINPNRPILYRPILVQAGQTQIRQLPPGFESLELSNIIARPGEALAIRATGISVTSVAATLDSQLIDVVTNNHHLVGIFGTGAFFPPGEHDLDLAVAGEPLWSQPWNFDPGIWSFEEINLTGSAAAIDAESIRQERERLSQIWAEVSEQPRWVSGFQHPVDNYLSVSSFFGARRSYNGGPYQSYHEGVDFSAYGGTPVVATAAGTVVVAEQLYVRGGAVIINHGLGLFSGTYHLEEVLAQPGQSIEKGQLIGKVGSTGLSTGNHLHWDFLVGGIWVDPVAWLDSDLACWVLEGWGTTCQN